MDEKYRLIPEEIPAVSRTMVYDRIMEEFSKGKSSSVRVEIPKKKPSTVHQGLLKMKRVNPSYASIGVVRRGDTIYLRK